MSLASAWALGAQRGDVLRIVFASTLVSVGGGIGAGLTLTFTLNAVLGSSWVRRSSGDPVILVAGTLLLSMVAGIACAIPARHAWEVDPMTALRCN